MIASTARTGLLTWLLLSCSFAPAFGAGATDPDDVSPRVPANDEDRQMEKAVRRGDLSAIQGALVAGADPDQPDPTGKTALMVAAKAGDNALVEDLLSRGASGLASNLNGGTPLMFAAISGDIDIIESLLALGADPDRRGSNGWGAVMIAAAKGHVKALQRLVEAGGDINNGDVYLWTPLHRVAYENRLEVATYLAGLSTLQIDALDDQGATALHHAAANGHEAMVELLLGRGARQIADADGRTPAIYADQRGHVRIARLLTK